MTRGFFNGINLCLNRIGFQKNAAPLRLCAKIHALVFAVFTLALAAGAQQPASWKSLAQMQGTLGFTNYVWDGDSVCLSNATHVLRFYQGRRRSEINDTAVWLNAVPEGNAKDGDWQMAEIDLDFLSLSIFPTAWGEMKPLRVMLDAGHGGMDDGACSKKPAVAEKNLVLDLVHGIGARLEEMGLEVVYTRTNDVAVSLEDRSLLARKTAADLFVSVHANFASNTNATGVETYVVPPAGLPGTSEGSRARGVQAGNANDYHSTLLGYSIHRHLTRADPNVPDRGLKRQSYFVLRETCCPSVLIEVGFLSNVEETKKMLGAKWQCRCADAIAAGITEYARKVEALTVAVNEKRRREDAEKEQAKALAAQKKAEAAAKAEAQKAEAEKKKAAEVAKKEAAAKELEKAVAVLKTEKPKSNPPAMLIDARREAASVASVVPGAKTMPPPQPKAPGAPQSIFDFYP